MSSRNARTLTNKFNRLVDWVEANCITTRTTPLAACKGSSCKTFEKMFPGLADKFCRALNDSRLKACEEMLTRIEARIEQYKRDGR
jgi:transcriptional regulator GlxA family with amidase domain